MSNIKESGLSDLGFNLFLIVMVLVVLVVFVPSLFNSPSKVQRLYQKEMLELKVVESKLELEIIKADQIRAGCELSEEDNE